MDAPTLITRMTEAGFTLEADGTDILVRPFSRLTGLQRQFIKTHKSATLAYLTGKASGADLEPPAPDPLNPSGDPELARMLALPQLDRMRELMWAGYRMEYEAGRLVRVIPPGQWAPIEAEPEGPHQGTANSHPVHQGNTDTGRVCCGDCGHFQRDRIGDPATGMGRCSVLDNPPGGLLYPRIERRCSRFVPTQPDPRHAAAMQRLHAETGRPGPATRPGTLAEPAELQEREHP